MDKASLDLTTNPTAQAQIACAIAGASATEMSGVLIALVMMPQHLDMHRAQLLTLHEKLTAAAQSVANLLDAVEVG